MSIRARIIECLRDSGRPLDYVAVAGRIGRSIEYTKTVFAQLHLSEYLRVVGSVPGVRAPRATYRPTAKGLALLDPEYDARRAAVATLKANRAAVTPATPQAPVRQPPARANANIWDVW